jgi:hypothetical protein
MHLEWFPFCVIQWSTGSSSFPGPRRVPGSPMRLRRAARRPEVRIVYMRPGLAPQRLLWRHTFRNRVQLVGGYARESLYPPARPFDRK